MSRIDLTSTYVVAAVEKLELAATLAIDDTAHLVVHLITWSQDCSFCLCSRGNDRNSTWSSIGFIAPLAELSTMRCHLGESTGPQKQFRSTQAPIPNKTIP